MLHHISFGVRDLDRAGRFYDAALAPLGWRRVFEDDEAIGYGTGADGEDLLCLKLRDRAQAPGAGFHLALAAPSREAAAAFHAAAIMHGGQDNGAAGLRPEYGAHYFAAFVIDPDGHAIEAVINQPLA